MRASFEDRVAELEKDKQIGLEGELVRIPGTMLRTFSPRSLEAAESPATRSHAHIGSPWHVWPDEKRKLCIFIMVLFAINIGLQMYKNLSMAVGNENAHIDDVFIGNPPSELAQREGLIMYNASAFAHMQPRIQATEKDVESPAAYVYNMMNNGSDVWGRIGYCRHGQSLLPDIPSSVCDWRTCIEVDGKAYNVDRLLLGREAAALSSTDGCYKVAGGQTARSIGPNEAPLLSFIYTIHNSPLLVARALLATFRTAHEISSAEFVVLDDGSKEDMTAVTRVMTTLQATFGTRIVKWRATKAYGYTNANTMALRLASGTYACLMNSDVFPLPGWLAGIYHTLRTFPGAGMVGPLQVSPKGSVMEAGGTVFQKGHPYNMGRPSWPWELPYLHSYSVDYISAACLLFDRREFLDLGLFDPQFAPAYFEDTDAALTMRRAGRLTVAMPLAAVVHFEGKSIPSAEKEAQMQKNMDRFYEKHADRLDVHCPSPRGWAQTCGDMSDIKRGMFFNTIGRQGNQVLVLHQRLPEADPEAGPVRSLEVVRVLVGMGYGVSLQHESETSLLKHMAPLLAAGVHVLRPGALRQLAAERAAHQALTGMEQAICPWQAGIVSGGGSKTSSLFELLRKVCPRIPLIYDSAGEGESVDVGLSQSSEFVIVGSTAEESLMAKTLGHERVKAMPEVLPNPTYRDDGSDYGNRRGGLFVGSMCDPSDIEASKIIMCDIFSDHAAFPKGFMRMVWFGDAKCKSVGDLSSEAKRHPLIELHMDITGKELHSLYAQANFFLAPKSCPRWLSRALWYGVPVIGSDATAKGFELLKSDVSMLTASGPESVRAGIRRLGEEEKLWRSLRGAGLLVAQHHFGHEAARSTLNSIFAGLRVTPRVSKSDDGRWVAAPVWKCPLPEDGKWGLFPGRQDSDCWAGKGRNPWVLMVPPEPYENELLADS